jgi:hypothetical protein
METNEQTNTAPTHPRKRRNIIWSIVLMVWPAVFIILSIMLYAIANYLFVMNGSQTDDASNSLRVVTNVILFILGAGGFLLGPISFIGGLVLLIVTLKKK